MLVLTRKRDQSIMIGPDIEVTVVDIKGDQVKLGIRAPSQVAIHRQEVFAAIEAENRAAARQSQTADLDAVRRALSPHPKASNDSDSPDQPRTRT